MASALQALKKAGVNKTLAEQLGTSTPLAEAQPTAPVAEAQAEEASATDDTAPIEVDPTKMSVKQLDDLVATYGIEVPDNWAKLKKDEKIAFLATQFEQAPDDAAAPAAAEATPEPEVVQVTEEEATTAKPKKAAGKKGAMTISSTKHGDVLSPDEFSKTVAEIENLKEADALALVGSLTDMADLTMFKVGGVLSRIQEDQWFKTLKFPNFRAYIEAIGMEYRKAMYWTKIYKDLVGSGVPYSAVAPIKWYKLKELASIITPENVEEWVQIALNDNFDTMMAKINAFKQSLTSDTTNQLSSTAGNVISTMTFKVHEDQKANIEAALEKAKSEVPTDVQTVALEAICISFMAGGKVPKSAKAVPLKDQLRAIGIEAAAQLLIDTFEAEYTINISIDPVEAVDNADAA